MPESHQCLSQKACQLTSSTLKYAPAKAFDLTGSRGTTATPDEARSAFDNLFKK